MSEVCAADSWNTLEETLGHRFGRRELLATALTHPSQAYETDGGRGNERLEFLGDAVLDLAVAGILYELRPDWSEGELTRARASLVNARALARCARALDLGRFLRLGRTEQRTGGAEKDSILANVFEAVLGAIYLDGGLAPVERLVRRVFEDELALGEPALERDVKTRFQEWAHARFRVTPGYRLLADSGVENDAARFEIEVCIGDEAWGRGQGRTKREAERAAACVALSRAGDLR